MPDSYSTYPTYEKVRPRMAQWKLDGVSVVEDTDATDDDEEAFDPGDYTIDDVKAHVEQNPGERDAVLAAEVAGKNRVTLVDWLTDYRV